MATTYATTTEVMEEIKRSPSLSTDTDIKSTSLDRFRDEAFALINQCIGTIYTLPITASIDLYTLRKIEIDIIVFRYHKIKSNPGAETENYHSSAVREAYKNSMALLMDIKNGKVILSGATKSTTSGVASYAETTTGIYEADQRW